MDSKHKRTMENGKKKEWKDNIKRTDWSSGARCTMGRRLEGQERWGEDWRDKSVAWAGSLGRGSIGWLLGSKGAHIVKVADGC